ncbi:hypothetical protein [Thetidibacter halocola]|uniref:Uncharacterized protein n=1 Tax=Thetidibacter halocola TaxID=2827239 RepID=A0A8J8B6M9_9RHOB|nr:hypothetical protein [Thetidibacter halocola]MBS0122730.1 hypothetical protein [Thetidibacter halocola]
MMRTALALLLGLGAALPLSAQDATPLRDRLRALAAPPAPTGLYADEAASDLALIAANREALFGAHRPMLGTGDGAAAIALFVGRDCAECDAARQDLEALVQKLDLRASLIDVDADPADAGLMARMTLDILPAYVMPDRLIRGAFPAFVLEGYLTGARR